MMLVRLTFLCHYGNDIIPPQVLGSTPASSPVVDSRYIFS
jgi:hypothetical protein